MAPEPKPLLSFVVGLSAAAAAVLFAFSLFIQKNSLPSNEDLGAQDRFWEEPQTPEGDPEPVLDEEEQADEETHEDAPAR